MLESARHSGCLNSPQPQPQWYVILTKPAGEQMAKLNLERQGYQVYFPQLNQRKPYRGKWRSQISALFPRYLFLQLSKGSQSLAPVRSTLGVAGAVRFGSEYAVVPQKVIDDLMRRADPQSGLHELKSPPLAPGAAVRIIGGSFADMDAIFERELGQDRVVVLFKLLGRDTPVSVPASFVIPACA